MNNPTNLDTMYYPLTCIDSNGNKYICISEYEAKGLRSLFITLNSIDIKGVSFDTGDWYRDVPFKIEKWLSAVGEGAKKP